VVRRDPFGGATGTLNSKKTSHKKRRFSYIIGYHQRFRIDEWIGFWGVGASGYREVLLISLRRI